LNQREREHLALKIDLEKDNVIMPLKKKKVPARKLGPKLGPKILMPVRPEDKPGVRQNMPRKPSDKPGVRINMSKKYK